MFSEYALLLVGWKTSSIYSASTSGKVSKSLEKSGNSLVSKKSENFTLISKSQKISSKWCDESSLLIRLYQLLVWNIFQSSSVLQLADIFWWRVRRMDCCVVSHSGRWLKTSANSLQSNWPGGYSRVLRLFFSPGLTPPLLCIALGCVGGYETTQPVLWMLKIDNFCNRL